MKNRGAIWRVLPRCVPSAGPSARCGSSRFGVHTASPPKQHRDSKKAIAIFGGSFNPPHMGHVAIVRSLLRRRSIQKVWIIPCWRHPFDKKLPLFKERYKMCRLAFKKFGRRVKISDIEKKLKGKSYTLRTLKYLIKKYPRQQFFLVLGGDTYREVKTWHGFKTLKAIAPWIVFQRGKKSFIPNISATQIRALLKKRGDKTSSLPREVLRYIKKKKLYC